jgi:hypothetical protein
MRRRDEACEPALQAWHDAELQPIDPDLLMVVHDHVETELASREGLGNRLAGLITVAGALLALSVAEAHTAATTHLDGLGRTIFSVAFVAAVSFLLAVMIISLRSLGPELRSVPEPELLRYYGERGSDIGDVRKDTYKLYVALLSQLAEGNRDRALGVRAGLGALIAALVFAAGAAGSVYFSTPWPTNQPTVPTQQAIRPTPRKGSAAGRPAIRVRTAKTSPQSPRSGISRNARPTAGRRAVIVPVADINLM